MRAGVRSWARWAADREVWPLCVGVALASVSARGAPWGLGLLALTWAVRWIGRGRPTTRTPLDWPACVLVATIPASFYATTDAETTFVATSRLVAGLALAYGLANWAQQEGQVSLLVWGMAGLGLGLAGFALVSVAEVRLPFLPASFDERVLARVGDAVNPNMMAGALVLALPFALSTALTGRLPPVRGTAPEAVARLLDGDAVRRAWFGLAAAGMAGVLALIRSRGGWIAGAGVVFLVLARRQRWLWALVPVAALGVGAIAWQVGPVALLDGLSSDGTLSGWERRAEVWSRAIYMIQDFPFTGVGAGTFGKVANVLYPFFLRGPDAEVPHAHNLMLQVGVDLGLPGLVGYVAILLAATWSGLESARYYREMGEEGLAAVAWAGLASLAGLMAHGMVDATTWIVGRGSFVQWAAIGMLIALAGRPRSRGRGEKASHLPVGPATEGREEQASGKEAAL